MLSRSRWVDPLTAAELAEVHRETIYRAIRRGELHAYRIGRGRLRIPVEDLERFVEGVPVIPAPTQENA
jgi:excisionase family DNA binding protein